MPAAMPVPAFRMDLAAEADLAQVAEVFADAFRESVRHVYGRPANPPAVLELFRLCLAAEPGAFFVAREGSRVTGYCFAPQRVRRLWGVFLFRGFAWRWAGWLLRGRLGVGWAELRRIIPDKLAFLITAARTRFGGDARVLSIGVRRDAQGRGVGGALLAAALGRLDRLGVPVVHLEVRPENAPALRLYERFGFERVGKCRDTKGEWVIMARRPRGVR